MSKIEVDAIDKQSGSTVTIGGSGTNVVLGLSLIHISEPTRPY